MVFYYHTPLFNFKPVYYRKFELLKMEMLTA
jgi:hypothetical protein